MMTNKQLKAQYDAEIAVNPEGWKNWQYLTGIFKDWIPKKDNYFRDGFLYRRNPDAPPFVAPHPDTAEPADKALLQEEIIAKLEVLLEAKNQSWEAALAILSEIFTKFSGKL
jgi:hypothetical protein